MAPLPPLPEGFAATRESLHRLAELVIKPAREQTSGGWTLIPTRNGFGTPVFGDDSQVRVDGAELVVREAGEERRAPIVSLDGAVELIGERLLPERPSAATADPLIVEREACLALGAAYTMAEAALERLREAAGEEDDPTEPTLWPEHFDLAIEMGEEESGRRANYGLSPGDDDHPEPYFYVGPWSEPAPGELWNASGFPGAELGYRELAAAEDPVGLALEFAEARRRALRGA
jgi:hypothetical protein